MLYIRRDGMFPPDVLRIPRMGDFLYSHLYDFTGLLHCVRNDKGGGKRAGKFTSLVIASKAERRRVAIQLVKIPAGWA